MQNLLVEVNLVRIGLLPHSLRRTRCPGSRTTSPRAPLLTCRRAGGRVDRGGNPDFLRLESGLVSLEHDFGFLLGVGWVDHEVVVVAAGHYVAAVAAEDDFEFIEDAVIFVCVTESRAEMLVDRDRLDRLAFHINVPDLDGEVVARENVAAIIGKADI